MNEPKLPKSHKWEIHSMHNTECLGNIMICKNCGQKIIHDKEEGIWLVFYDNCRPRTRYLLSCEEYIMENALT